MGAEQSIALLDETAAATTNTLSGVSGTAGTGTILHKDAPKASEPQFTIDFSTLSATQSVSGTEGSITINIGADIAGKVDATGGTDVTITISSPSMTGAQIASAVADAINGTDFQSTTTGNAYDGIKIGDYVYTAEAKDGKVVFTLSQKVAGADTTDANKQVVKSNTDSIANTAVAVKVDGADEAKFSGSINTGALEIVEGVPEGGTQYANAQFNLTKDMIADGNTLTIGGETYTFKVGSDSVVGKNVKNVIDLSDMKPDDAKFMETAAARLTQAAANNAMFTVGAQGATGATDTFTIGIQEKATYKGDADLTTVKGIKEQLSWAKADTSAATAAKSLTLQIGDTSDDYNKLKLHIDATDAATLGIADINIGTQEGAAAADRKSVV